MINPELSSVLPYVVSAVPVIGAAIFKIRANVVNKDLFRVETKQLGHGHVLATQESDPETADTYVGVPSGSVVHTWLQKHNLIVALDYRARETSPGNLRIAQGPTRSESTIKQKINDTEIHEEILQGVSVRYLGDVHKRVLKQSPLKALFEHGAPPQVPVETK